MKPNGREISNPGLCECIDSTINPRAQKERKKKVFFFFVNSESCRVSQVAASVDS